MNDKKRVQHTVVGMAGHIDHGKTSLVNALTGTNTDRLKEEIERGMTTDLGFAFLGKDITIIDVPGHERFVKTMVAGVNSVDCAMLVIAADDGVMPQTREHLEILNLLQVHVGVVAITKIDLVESEWCEMVIDEVRQFLKGSVLETAPIVPVSSLTKKGIDVLKEEIVRIAGTLQDRKDKGIFRLLIDRAFSIKGFGTVVAGTVLSGKVSPEDTVELLPQGLKLRVKNVQVHDEPVLEATIGFRTALNLGRIDKESVERGNVIAEPGYFIPTYMVDAYFTFLKNKMSTLKNRTRVRVHIGTSEVIGRIVILDKKEYASGDEGFVQLHFEKPVIADTNDRFVVRSYSPVQTIGGGVILDTHPKTHKQLQQEVLSHLERLHNGDPNQIILEFFNRERFIPKSEEEISKGIGVTQEETSQRIAVLESEGSVVRVNKKKYLSSVNLALLRKKIIILLETFHEENPLLLSISAAKLCVMIKQPVDRLLFSDITNDLKQNGTCAGEQDQIRLATASVTLTPKLLEYKQTIQDRFLKNPLNPPKLEEILDEMGDKVKKLVAYMIASGDLVMIDKEICFHKDALETAKKSIKGCFNPQKETASLHELRAALGGDISRNKLIAILEYFDSKGVTIREGDLRRLK